MTGREAFEAYCRARDVFPPARYGKDRKRYCSWAEVPDEDKASWDAWAEGYLEEGCESFNVMYPNCLPERNEL